MAKKSLKHSKKNICICIFYYWKIIMETMENMETMRKLIEITAQS